MNQRYFLFLLTSISTLFANEIISTNLEFIPSHTFDSLSYPKKNIWKTHKLKIASFNCSKKDIQKIGIINHKGAITELHTTTELSLWTENVLKYSLQKSGISVVNDAPTIILRGNIKEFNIEGTDSLSGNLSIDIELLNHSNQILYSGTIKSNITKHCINMGTIDCFKITSDMLIGWIQNFLNTPGVSQAAIITYHNTVILHDFNYLHKNLISEIEVPEKKPILKKIGTLVTCLGIAPLITGIISKSKGNNTLADPLFVIGSTATSAGLTTTGISFAFDIKYHSFQSKFRVRKDLSKKSFLEYSNLHTMLDR